MPTSAYKSAANAIPLSPTNFQRKDLCLKQSIAFYLVTIFTTLIIR